MKSGIQISTLAALWAAAFPLAAADEVVVSATRFIESPTRAAANVSVITREDIARSPATDVPSLLKDSAGVLVSALYGGRGIDATVDLRGFGENGTNNTLVLLDGQRLNPVDGGSIMWSAIPLDAIERIEILRGQGTVAFGDRASGGVINIITRKTAPTALSVSVGSFNTRSAEFQTSAQRGDAYATVFARHGESTGWRRNNQSDQDTLSGRLGVCAPTREGFVDYAFYRESLGLPGALYSAAYAADPRSARNPFDTQARWGYRLRPGASFLLGQGTSLDLEVSVEHDHTGGNFVSFGSQTARDRDTLSFTPRLRGQHSVFGFASDSVLGVDFYHGLVSATYSSFADQSARQQSEALYFVNTTALAPRWALNVGGRVQRMDQRAEQAAYDAGFGLTPGLRGGTEKIARAFDLGVSYQAAGVRAFAKTGTTFRFASTDELFGYDVFNNVPVFAGDLRPQRGRIEEIGVSTTGPVAARVSVYRLRLVDEIGYDASTGANRNFDPTTRRGLEAELDWRLHAQWKLGASLSHTEAEFADGPNRGHTLPLVARDQASVRLHWLPQSSQQLTLAARRVGERVGSGDFANALDRLPAYTTVDLAAAWDLRALRLQLKAANLFDKRYATYGGFDVYRPDYYYYPADGRSVQLSARYDFK